MDRVATLSYLIQNHAEGIKASEKIVAVAFSIILVNRFKAKPDNFSVIRYYDRKYPLMKKDAAGPVMEKFLFSMHIARRLIQKRELRSLAIVITKGRTKPFDIIDQYRIKLKFATDNIEPGRSYQIKLHTATMLDELAKFTKMAGAVPEDAYAYVSFETGNYDVGSTDIQNISRLIKYEPEDNVDENIPTRSFGRIDTPYAYIAIKASSKTILTNKVEVESLSRSQAAPFEDL